MKLNICLAMNKNNNVTRVFHKHKKLGIMALLPTLYSHMFASTDVSKYEIRNQGVHKHYISGLNALFDRLIYNGNAKTKLAMLAFLYCREFVIKEGLSFP